MGLPQVYGSSDPKYALTLVVVTILALFYCFQWLKPQPFRLVNGRKFGELTNVRAKKEFMFGARQLIAKGLALAPGFPFRVIGDVGEILILPPKYAHEIRNHDHLSFTQAAFKWFYAHLPGFEGFREGTTESHIMKLVARNQLTHQLKLVTEPVSDECSSVLDSIYTNNAARRGERFECNDAIDWLEQTAQDKKLTYDPACAQLSLSVAALHSTTDFFTQVMLDIACNPELVEPLRKEIISVLGVAGWSKHSLYQLKLMDSVLKESQRLKPIAIASMRRMTTENIKLADGTVLPKNTLTLVSAHKHWDAGSYEEPHRFDGYRFYNLRQVPGKENVSQLVSVSPDHMGFGYGLHACPGRFFASEEIKLVLCHILLKYDFRLVEGTDIEPRKFGLNMNANPAAKLAVRRRKEEIIL
ncbi:probable cytochrome P450 monooxygenase (lovA) [Claviceps purpurea 20.1]|uniref:Probable cytochrome P450 monooxygenase (LovA) n=1 Tax=Claviceps purpurea (strain 20.1) TaxID=1111077 RepID=M1WFC0_CLAP2|nr:probable cytochrome P450 monooxygenase (lovA) [Claviceps purpurea 20.1]